MKRFLTAALLLAVVAGCAPAGNTDLSQTETTETTATQTESTATMDTAAATPASQEGQPMTAYQNKIAEIHTTAGEIDIRFFTDAAPNHVKNFIDLAQKGFYNGTKFHRVIPGFMIQGGDPNTKSADVNTWGMGGSGSNVKAEFSAIPHKRGIVSMARSSDPNSASSQFFIVVADSGFLDNQYSVFGEVTKGMDVADKIVAAPRGPSDRPNEPTSITSITIRDARPDEVQAAPASR